MFTNVYNVNGGSSNGELKVVSDGTQNKHVITFRISWKINT